MSTRAYVLVEQDDGEIKGVYVHNCGADLLPVLKKYYSTKTKRDALIKLGDLSVLSAKTSKPPKGIEHTVGQSIPGYCVAYHRDRGDEWSGFEFESWKAFKEWLYEALEESPFEPDYLYLWDRNGNWYQYKSVNFREKGKWKRRFVFDGVSVE